MEKSLPTPPPPEYLPYPPLQWLQQNEYKSTAVITFCHECENVFYVYDKEKQCIRQYLYKCKCEM